MRQYGDAETGRRKQLESALSEATALFKRELAAKNNELADAQAELGCESCMSAGSDCILSGEYMPL